MTSVGVMASGVHLGVGPVLLSADPCDNFTYAPWITAGTTAINAAGHTGNGIFIPNAAGNSARYQLAPAAETATMTLACWIRFPALPASIGTFASFRSDAAATSHVELRCINPAGGGRLSVWRGTTANLGQSAAATIAGTATWYYLEVAARLHDTAGSVTVRLDGTPIITITTQDTKNGGTKTVFDALTFQGSLSPNVSVLLDDITIRNDLAF